MTLNLNLAVLWPVLAPALAALVVLILDVFHRKAGPIHLGIAVVALAGGAVATLPGLVQDATDRRGAFCLASGECLYAAGTLTSGLQLLALVSALIVVALAWPDWVHRDRGSGGTAVQAVLLLAATAGVVAVPAARDLGSLLVALELATLPTVALVALERRRSREARAVEGAVALLTTSLVSFALLVLGAALWVAATGSGLLTSAAAYTAIETPGRAPLLVLAAVFAVSGIGFKLSAAPFHAWTPLTYAAAPLPVTAYLAGASKVAAAGALVVLVQALSGASGFTLVAVGVLAAASMTLGNVMALRQDNLVRLLAWSAVAQAGWVMLPLAVVSARAAQAAVGYLTVYVVATLLAFAVLLGTARSLGGVDLAHHRGLVRTHPVLATVLGFGLLTLAGLPPAVVGLVAKVVALRPVAGEGMWWLAVVAALNVALGIAVYLRWLGAIVARPEQPVPAGEPPETRAEQPVAVGKHADGAPFLPWPHRVVVGVLAGALVLGSIAPVGIW